MNYPHNRINVVGVSSSGKSTFAQALAKKLAFPCLEMDAIYWGPNWSEPENEAFFKKLETTLDASETWVLEGNYSKTNPIKWSRASQVIWIDHPFPTTLYRAIKRAVRRASTKEELWPGTNNRESFRKSFFSHDSVILWTITSYWKVRQSYLNTMADPKLKHIQFVHLQGQKQANTFLQQIS